MQRNELMWTRGLWSPGKRAVSFIVSRYPVVGKRHTLMYDEVSDTGSFLKGKKFLQEDWNPHIWG